MSGKNFISTVDPSIYIMVGSWTPELKKIGWANDWRNRRGNFEDMETNRGETFHCLATLTSKKTQEDRNLHKFIEERYPNAVYKYREWYNLSSAQALSILDEYAKCRNAGFAACREVNPENDPYFDPKTFEPTVPGLIPMSILPSEWSKRKKFTFSERGIPMNATLVFISDTKKTCTVCGEREVMYNGKRYASLSALTCKILHRKIGTSSGTERWMYNGMAVRYIYPKA